MIEPYRPIIDLHVAKFRPLDEDEPLLPRHKADLVALLNVDVGMPRGEMSGLSSIEQTVESLARLYEGADESCLELPRLIDLRQHAREM